MNREKMLRVFAHVQGEILALNMALDNLQYSPVDGMTLERLVGERQPMSMKDYGFLKHYSDAHLVEVTQQAITQKNELLKRLQKYKDQQKMNSVCEAIGMMYPNI